MVKTPCGHLLASTPYFILWGYIKFIDYYNNFHNPELYLVVSSKIMCKTLKKKKKCFFAFLRALQ